MERFAPRQLGLEVTEEVQAQHLSGGTLAETSDASESSDVPTLESTQSALTSMVIEAWRFAGVFATVVAKLDPLTAEKFANRSRYFQSKIVQTLESAGLRIVDLSGQAFDAGVAATALNSDEFESGDMLVIDYMIEPLIMSSDSVIHYATVVVRKGE